MTKHERFLAFANFEPVDRVPRHAGYIPELRDTITAFLGQDPVERFHMDDGVTTGLKSPEDQPPPDYSGYYPEYEDGKDGFKIQGGVGKLNHGFHHFTETISPLRHATRFEDLEAFPLVSNEGWSDAHMADDVARAHADGNFARGAIGHMYETAWAIRDYEGFLMDLLTRREWAEFLLEHYCANNIRSAVAAARAGCDVLHCGDDVANQNAMMFQPDLWREVMKPRWARVYAAAREHKPDIQVWYHSDGNVWDILDDLVEIGVTILNPVQPECMDPFAIRRRFGKRLAFDGCVGTQTTFPFGSPHDMKQTVQTLAEALDAGHGGLMLSPTHVLEPEVPPANVVAFFEACDELAFDSAQ